MFMLKRYFIALSVYFSILILGNAHSDVPEALYSLLSNVQDQLEQIQLQLEAPNDTNEFICSSVEESLWEKAQGLKGNESLLHSAKVLLFKGDQHLSQAELFDAKEYYYRAFLSLFTVWIQENDNDPISALNLELNNISSEYEKNLIVQFMQENRFSIFKSDIINTNHSERKNVVTSYDLATINPYLIPNSHHLKHVLDAIFQASRATLNKKTFAAAGFVTHFSQPRSHIRVASHPNLPGYLVKVNFDSELRIKDKIPSWVWFVRRCEAATIIRQVIAEKKITKFVVPKKYLYKFPDNPAPPDDPTFSRKEVLIIVKKMQLMPAEENLNLWKTHISTHHLLELYTILSRTPEQSGRPDNIVFTTDGITLAFIDTEYKSMKPSYSGIAPYLSVEMKAYWKYLIKNGKQLGP